jgi:hypothetical protein
MKPKFSLLLVLVLFLFSACAKEETSESELKESFSLEYASIIVKEGHTKEVYKSIGSLFKKYGITNHKIAKEYLRVATPVLKRRLDTIYSTGLQSRKTPCSDRYAREVAVAAVGVALCAVGGPYVAAACGLVAGIEIMNAYDDFQKCLTENA